MFIARYSRTQAGAQRLAQQRGLSLPLEQPERKAAPAPQINNVVKLVIPRTENQRIIADVARQHGFTYVDILGKSRRRKVVQARFDAIAAVKAARPMISLQQLGHLFHKDHTSIYHALKQRGLA
ncbi:helix-turn-helix domain-containing protein [Mesorhizobium sp. B2-1-3A]|uniref:helix-turn-helix domain-containing protein n=1 Tax=Mesorhizobium sp. B2-1-3A TaxID=2589971 RepID=UPI00112B15FC|nr:helix-turn-helix domain-containing protein [Mesorhizobium sp. B2-1-3A]TPM89846.1 hypothetical protein FJ977_35290 [Mesorhizobium sp. B2-1-3A]